MDHSNHDNCSGRLTKPIYQHIITIMIIHTCIHSEDNDCSMGVNIGIWGADQYIVNARLPIHSPTISKLCMSNAGLTILEIL